MRNICATKSLYMSKHPFMWFSFTWSYCCAFDCNIIPAIETQQCKLDLNLQVQNHDSRIENINYSNNEMSNQDTSIEISMNSGMEIYYQVFTLKVLFKEMIEPSTQWRIYQVVHSFHGKSQNIIGSMVLNPSRMEASHHLVQFL